MSYGRLAPSAALLDDASPIEAFFPATLETWFAGSHVTVDGRPTDRPLMVFRGCAVGDDDVGAVDVVSGKPLDVFWATSSRRNAAFFEDGEIQNLYIRLLNPFVFHAPPFSPSGVVRRIWEDVQAGLSDWDGVIFEDIVDGSHPSVVYAVFPKQGTVRDRVRIVGRTHYDADGDAVHCGIQPPGADPDRFDEIRHDDYEPATRTRERTGCLS